jgi:hypothetical protein
VDIGFSLKEEVIAMGEARVTGEFGWISAEVRQIAKGGVEYSESAPAPGANLVVGHNLGIGVENPAVEDPVADTL